jgi:hypothetical protein
MARTPRENEIPLHEITPVQDTNIGELIEAGKTLDALTHQAQENALAVAQQVGYDGPLTVGGVEDGIRFYQRRTAEACVELGKRLLILKELTPHGEFQQRIELLGFSKSTAKRFMQATLKFSKTPNLGLLTGKVQSQSKLLELVMLDDSEIEALETGDTVRGITLDRIETMSVSELKKALRDAKATADAKDDVIQQKTQELNKKAEELALLENRRRGLSPSDVALELRNNVQAVAADIKTDVMTRLRGALKVLHELDGDHKTFCAGCLVEIGRELAMLRADYNLPAAVSEDLLPEWLTQDALDEINAMGNEARHERNPG